MLRILLKSSYSRVTSPAEGVSSPAEGVNSPAEGVDSLQQEGGRGSCLPAHGAALIATPVLRRATHAVDAVPARQMDRIRPPEGPMGGGQQGV
eukprot:543586-Prorocentrum_minimum.AAC.1